MMMPLFLPLIYRSHKKAKHMDEVSIYENVLAAHGVLICHTFFRKKNPVSFSEIYVDMQLISSCTQVLSYKKVLVHVSDDDDG